MTLDLEEVAEKSSQRTSSSPRRRFHVKRWANPPRWPPFDRYNIPRGPIKISRAFYKVKCQSVFDFTWPAVFWAIGKQFAGKSTVVEDVALEYVARGGTAVDVFSADDDEGAGWANSGYKVLFLTGKRVDLEPSDGSQQEMKGDGVARVMKLKNGKTVDWMHVSDLKISTPEQIRDSLLKLGQYQVVVTVPSFFYDMNEMFHSLSALIDLLKRRGLVQWTFQGHRHIFCVMVREAKVLLASRYYSGKITSRQDAEMDMIDLVDKAFHTGVALCIDSLRYMSITPEVRDITHYQFIKKLGRMKLPPEFDFIMRYVNPRYMRKMPKSHFVLYTDDDDVYAGTNDPVDWHVKRGEPVLEGLGIRPVYKAKERRAVAAVVNPAAAGSQQQPEDDEEEEIEGDDNQRAAGPGKWKVSLAIHKRIVNLVVGGSLSYASAKSKMENGDDVDPPYPVHLSVATLYKEVKSHKENLCLCPERDKEEEAGE